MKTKITIGLLCIATVLTWPGVAGAQTAASGPKVQLPSGETVWDLNGDWEALSRTTVHGNGLAGEFPMETESVQGHRKWARAESRAASCGSLGPQSWATRSGQSCRSHRRWGASSPKRRKKT
jgi:hypothetical protein